MFRQAAKPSELAKVAKSMPDISEKQTNVLICKQLASAEFLRVVILDRPHEAYSGGRSGKRSKHEEPAAPATLQRQQPYSHWRYLMKEEASRGNLWEACHQNWQ